MTQTPDPIICPRCGQTNAQGRTQCWNCGAFLAGPPPPPKPRGWSCWKIGCLVLAIISPIVIALVSIAAFFLMKSDEPSGSKEIEYAIRRSSTKQISAPAKPGAARTKPVTGTEGHTK